MNTLYRPLSRQDGLRVNVVADETLLYDTATDQAVLLNPTAAFVWNHADGTRSVSEIAAAMSESFQTPVDTRVVWYAIEQLSKKNLMRERTPAPAAYAHLTRRDLLAKAGLVSAALAIPVVISMMAPPPAHAQSCVSPIACDGAIDCCSKCCIGSVCRDPADCV